MIGGSATPAGSLAMSVHPIASRGPTLATDVRLLCLKDITLIGCTAWDEPVFPDLVSYIERNEIRPLVAKVYPLKETSKLPCSTVPPAVVILCRALASRRSNAVGSIGRARAIVARQRPD